MDNNERNLKSVAEIIWWLHSVKFLFGITFLNCGASFGQGLGVLTVLGLKAITNKQKRDIVYSGI